MPTTRPLEVQRQKNDRLGGGNVSCAIVFDREFTPEEMQRFHMIPTSDTPQPRAFSFEGRVVRYVCSEADEPAWRLALEIFLVKTFRQTTEVATPAASRNPRNTRGKLGLRKLHLG